MNRKHLLLSLPIASLLLASCGTAEVAEPVAGDSGNAVKVVASTTQICDYVTQIASGGELGFTKTDAAGKTTKENESAPQQLKLTCLLAPNASAHDHEMTREQMSALADADVLFVNGVDLEHFLDDAISSSGFHGTLGVTTGVLSAADKDDLAAQEEKEKDLPYTVNRGEQQVAVEEWPFAPEPGEEAEFRYDPHVWTNPKFASIQVANIGHVLSNTAPDAEKIFEKQVKDYQAKLAALDTWSKESFQSVDQKHRVLFTSHDAFGYLSNAYDIEFVGAALSDFNEQQDATAEHIRKASEQVKQSGAVALFAENSNNSKSIEAIAKAAGVKAVIGDDALYGDSLGPADSDGETYIGSIVHNVNTLVKAWDGKPAELPKELS
ncbi:metal ABC transporter substrate-binding protein [Corynebacterium freiburgense]|uniref:metal ABC transporter substrate-binding protein n=1 Tax=Corynebacterium freiburgense TaxID=556548 RepID=UPI000420D042|nr:metal ABC transporter substrate-binding protein [Corynebacterium freiburgense]WJZ01782.1 Periplasmic zinc-binding protein TroA precursor [Corynebacterium freiburgense]